MLNFIGCGSAFNTKLGNNSAFIKEGSSLLLIDCGSATFERIQRTNLLDDIENIYILLTHTHPDHIGSLGDLIFYGYYAIGEIMKPNVTILAPYELKIKPLLRAMGVVESTYKLIQISGTISINNNDFCIQFEAKKVNHVKWLDCFAYSISYQGKQVYYSGDANEITNDILEKLNNGEIDFFYQDTCKADYQDNPHLSLRKLNELVSVHVRNKVYCMHLDNDFKVEDATTLGFNVVTPIT